MCFKCRHGACNVVFNKTLNLNNCSLRIFKVQAGAVQGGLPQANTIRNKCWQSEISKSATCQISPPVDRTLIVAKKIELHCTATKNRKKHSFLLLFMVLNL